MDCKQCREEGLERNCVECKELISGKLLAKRPKNNFKVELEKINGNKTYMGTVELISPVGLVLKTDNISAGKYKAKLLNDLEIIISTIKDKGKNGYHSFDIISVIRGEEESKKLNKENFEILIRSSNDIINKLTEDLPQTTKNIVRNKLKNDIEKSKLLDAFEVGEVLKYKKGNIKRLSTSNGILLSDNYLKKFVNESIRDRSYRREKTIDEEGERVYDLHAIPMDYKSGGIIAVDVTEIIFMEKEQRQKELEIYRDIIEIVTGGKLKLINSRELKSEMNKGCEVSSQKLEKKEDVKKVREKVKKVLKDFSLDSKENTHIILAISEAVTNALKHGGGGGFALSLINEKILRAIIFDQGPGIDFSKLPKVTLMDKFSDYSGFSLGNGFTIMSKFMDTIFLKTDKNGTTLILEKELRR
ncbi:ATP-binding protein [Sporohalobacter salinus]|uniref:ATP-binding protein n=1 Tax=Sporohalobacter salinus TaxID=1494606 RepID=UPI00195FDBD1|nr:ATP-binding protein [Sporohalobacter salinus]MBM7622554.1 anti-sigma regulatory factor (Ser/Thr protein kinase) [Sporohalobacter salinus]